MTASVFVFFLIFFLISFSVPPVARVAFATARALILASFPAWKKLWPEISPLLTLNAKSSATARGG
jgi:hypothetical protein